MNLIPPSKSSVININSINRATHVIPIKPNPTLRSEDKKAQTSYLPDRNIYANASTTLTNPNDVLALVKCQYGFDFYNSFCRKTNSGSSLNGRKASSTYKTAGRYRKFICPYRNQNSNEELIELLSKGFIQGKISAYLDYSCGKVDKVFDESKDDGPKPKTSKDDACQIKKERIYQHNLDIYRIKTNIDGFCKSELKKKYDPCKPSKDLEKPKLSELPDHPRSYIDNFHILSDTNPFAASGPCGSTNIKLLDEMEKTLSTPIDLCSQGKTKTPSGRLPHKPCAPGNKDICLPGENSSKKPKLASSGQDSSAPPQNDGDSSAKVGGDGSSSGHAAWKKMNCKKMDFQCPPKKSKPKLCPPKPKICHDVCMALKAINEMQKDPCNHNKKTRKPCKMIDGKLVCQIKNMCCVLEKYNPCDPKHTNISVPKPEDTQFSCKIGDMFCVCTKIEKKSGQYVVSSPDCCKPLKVNKSVCKPLDCKPSPKSEPTTWISPHEDFIKRMGGICGIVKGKLAKTHGPRILGGSSKVDDTACKEKNQTTAEQVQTLCKASIQKLKDCLTTSRDVSKPLKKNICEPKLTVVEICDPPLKVKKASIPQFRPKVFHDVDPSNICPPRNKRTDGLRVDPSKVTIRPKPKPEDPCKPVDLKSKICMPDFKKDAVLVCIPQDPCKITAKVAPKIAKPNILEAPPKHKSVLYVPEDPCKDGDIKNRSCMPEIKAPCKICGDKIVCEFEDKTCVCEIYNPCKQEHRDPPKPKPGDKKSICRIGDLHCECTKRCDIFTGLKDSCKSAAKDECKVPFPSSIESCEENKHQSNCKLIEGKLVFELKNTCCVCEKFDPCNPEHANIPKPRSTDKIVCCVIENMYCQCIKKSTIKIPEKVRNVNAECTSKDEDKEIFFKAIYDKVKLERDARAARRREKRPKSYSMDCKDDTTAGKPSTDLVAEICKKAKASCSPTEPSEKICMPAAPNPCDFDVEDNTVKQDLKACRKVKWEILTAKEKDADSCKQLSKAICESIELANKHECKTCIECPKEATTEIAVKESVTKCEENFKNDCMKPEDLQTDCGDIFKTTCNKSKNDCIENLKTECVEPEKLQPDCKEMFAAACTKLDEPKMEICGDFQRTYREPMKPCIQDDPCAKPINDLCQPQMSDQCMPKTEQPCVICDPCKPIDPCPTMKMNKMKTFTTQMSDPCASKPSKGLANACITKITANSQTGTDPDACDTPKSAINVYLKINKPKADPCNFGEPKEPINIYVNLDLLNKIEEDSTSCSKPHSRTTDPCIKPNSCEPEKEIDCAPNATVMADFSNDTTHTCHAKVTIEVPTVGNSSSTVDPCKPKINLPTCDPYKKILDINSMCNDPCKHKIDPCSPCTPSDKQDINKDGFKCEGKSTVTKIDKIKIDPCKRNVSDSASSKNDPCKPSSDLGTQKSDPCKSSTTSSDCGNKPIFKCEDTSACAKNDDPCKPKIELCKPKKTDPCPPKKDPCKPKIDPCKPKIDPCKPKTDPCPPKKDPCKPKEDPCKPKTDPCLPKKDPCKPKEDPCKPKTDPCPPKKDPCKPKEDPCKPKTDPCPPKKDPCKPKTDPCAPTEDPRKATSNSVKRKSVLTPCPPKPKPPKKESDSSSNNPSKPQNVKSVGAVKKKECYPSPDSCSTKSDPCLNQGNPCEKDILVYTAEPKQTCLPIKPTTTKDNNICKPKIDPFYNKESLLCAPVDPKNECKPQPKSCEPKIDPSPSKIGMCTPLPAACKTMIEECKPPPEVCVPPKTKETIQESPDPRSAVDTCTQSREAVMKLEQSNLPCCTKVMPKILADPCCPCDPMVKRLGLEANVISKYSSEVTAFKFHESPAKQSAKQLGRPCCLDTCAEKALKTPSCKPQPRKECEQKEGSCDFLTFPSKANVDHCFDSYNEKAPAIIRSNSKMLPMIPLHKSAPKEDPCETQYPCKKKEESKLYESSKYGRCDDSLPCKIKKSVMKAVCATSIIKTQECKSRNNACKPSGLACLPDTSKRTKSQVKCPHVCTSTANDTLQFPCPPITPPEQFNILHKPLCEATCPCDPSCPCKSKPEINDPKLNNAEMVDPKANLCSPVMEHNYGAKVEEPYSSKAAVGDPQDVASGLIKQYADSKAANRLRSSLQSKPNKMCPKHDPCEDEKIEKLEISEEMCKKLKGDADKKICSFEAGEDGKGVCKFVRRKSCEEQEGGCSEGGTGLGTCYKDSCKDVMGIYRRPDCRPPPKNYQPPFKLEDCPEKLLLKQSQPETEIITYPAIPPPEYPDCPPKEVLPPVGMKPPFMNPPRPRTNTTCPQAPPMQKSPLVPCCQTKSRMCCMEDSEPIQIKCDKYPNCSAIYDSTKHRQWCAMEVKGEPQIGSGRTCAQYLKKKAAIEGTSYTMLPNLEHVSNSPRFDVALPEVKEDDKGLVAGTKGLMQSICSAFCPKKKDFSKSEANGCQINDVICDQVKPKPGCTLLPECGSEEDKEALKAKSRKQWPFLEQEVRHGPNVLRGCQTRNDKQAYMANRSKCKPKPIDMPKDDPPEPRNMIKENGKWRKC